jgi:hypothetical protein
VITFQKGNYINQVTKTPYPTMNELQFQAKCAKAYNEAFPKYRNNLYRIKNELDNHPRKMPKDRIKQLGENASTGVRPGISDFVLIDPAGDSHWIELKIEGGKQSTEQKAFQEIVRHYYVVFDLDTFIELCRLILK